jgi:uncharacterized damage-inducible protein DinB
MRPTESDVSPAHFAYIQLVEGDDIFAAIEQQSSATQKLLASLDESRAGYRYAEGKWSVKEVIGHLVDAERILGYRALAIARGDTQDLPGFDEQDYVRHANFDDWRLGDLSEAYALARRATIVFFRNLPEEAWDRRGSANGFEVTVRALAWSIAGHELHHMKTLRDRYRL